MHASTCTCNVKFLAWLHSVACLRTCFDEWTKNELNIFLLQCTDVFAHFSPCSKVTSETETQSLKYTYLEKKNPFRSSTSLISSQAKQTWHFVPDNKWDQSDMNCMHLKAQEISDRKTNSNWLSMQPVSGAAGIWHSSSPQLVWDCFIWNEWTASILTWNQICSDVISRIFLPLLLRLLAWERCGFSVIEK